MKIFVPLRKQTARIVPGIIIAMLLSVTERASAIPSQGRESLSFHYLDSIVVEKQLTNKKHKIRLYPNANQQVLFFSANGEHGKIYQLFLFDMDGKLVKQANIKNKQTTVINNIDKGVYLFEVFSDDERIENGKVTVR
ncbi:MAG: T9SS type A sorting domain-containing protein [Chitinophagaceae bacterium]|nr:T9SS type A sorting domain-containing protein [Chitinophagaceae bacterium]